MRFAAVLCPALAIAQDTVSCDAGTQVGIDMYGADDASNTDTCYPTLTAANIDTCNDATGAAVMTVKISQDFYSSFGTVDGYTQDADNNWIKNIPLQRANMRLSADGSDVELVYSIQSEQTMLNGVYFNVQRSIEFVCAYSLEDQSIEADFNIAGKDMEFARTSRGQLIYTLIPTAETVIGDTHPFQIVPATPGVIYSRITQCTVVNVGDTTQTYDLTTVDGTNVCRDPVTSFDITSTGGFCTDQTQTFQYTSFRWSTSTDAVEAQKLRCTIALDYEKASATEMQYNQCA